MEITEIVSSWATALNPSELQKETAAKRLEICKSCEHIKDFGGIFSYCGVCGCPSRGKVFSPNGCPKDLWKI
jgi:hypothetical protein